MNVNGIRHDLFDNEKLFLSICAGLIYLFLRKDADRSHSFT